MYTRCQNAENTAVVIIMIIHSSQVLVDCKNVGFFLKINTNLSENNLSPVVQSGEWIHPVTFLALVQSSIQTSK